MNAREDWLKARKSGIGGTDIGAIIGMSPFKTPLDVYLDKIGQDDPQPMNEAMYFGTIMEGIVADEYARRNNRRVQRVNSILRHVDKDWMLANIDRAVVAEGTRARLDASGKLQGASGILECKTASAYKQGEWGRDGDDDAVPATYAAQAMWYMAVTGQEWCDVAVLIGGNKYMDKRIERCDDTIKGMIERADEFWHGHVLAGIPPEPSNESDIKRLYPQSEPGKVVEATEELHNIINQLRDVRLTLKRCEAEESALLVMIKAMMAEAEAAEYMGVTLATWKSSAPGRKTDWKAVAFENAVCAAHIEKHTKTTPAIRRFLLKGEK